MTHHELLLAAADRLDCADGADGNCDMEPPCSEYATALRALTALPIPSPRPELRPAREVADDVMLGLFGEHFRRNPVVFNSRHEVVMRAIEADRLSRPEVLGRDGSLSSGRPAKQCTRSASMCEDDGAHQWDEVTERWAPWAHGMGERCSHVFASNPPDADTHFEQPNQALLITGKHPTCPACESLVLPTGMCVNGCRNPNESKARADGKDKP